MMVEKKKTEDKSMEETRTPWHPAFIQAIQMELLSYRDALSIQSEYQLNAEPYKIDALITKKDMGLVIEKNIGSIFRQYNIMEFKSPFDYISVFDFYKVYGYACFYSYLHKADISSLSITLIGTKYPKALIQHLQEKRKYTVKEAFSGIYIVEGDIMPIQIIEMKRLSEDDNIFLKGLSHTLNVESLNRIVEKSIIYGEGLDISAYWYVLYKANPLIFEEILNMRDTKLEEMLVRTGWAEFFEKRAEERGEKRGEKQGIKEVLELWQSGKTPEEVLAILGVDEDSIDT